VRKVRKGRKEGSKERKEGKKEGKEGRVFKILLDWNERLHTCLKMAMRSLG
jgi:hypothetical protein